MYDYYVFLFFYQPCFFLYDKVNFDLTTPNNRDTTDHTHPARKNSQSGYVYESDTVRRAYPVSQTSTPTTSSSASSAMMKMSNANSASLTSTSSFLQPQQQSVRAKDIPYHAREDSQPFTYGMVTNGHHHQENGSGGAGSVGNGATSTPTSPSIHRRNWKESSSNTNNGQPSKRLESPSLVRKFSNGSEPAISPVRSVPRIPVPSIADPASPRPIRKLSESLLLNGSGGGGGGGGGGGVVASPSPDNAGVSSSAILPVATSSPRLDTSRNRSASTSEMIKTSTPQHHISLEETIQDVSTSPDSTRYVLPNLFVFFCIPFSFRRSVRRAMPSHPEFPSTSRMRLNCRQSVTSVTKGNGSSCHSYLPSFSIAVFCLPSLFSRPPRWKMEPIWLSSENRSVEFQQKELRKDEKKKKQKSTPLIFR